MKSIMANHFAKLKTNVQVNLHQTENKIWKLRKSKQIVLFM